MARLSILVPFLLLALCYFHAVASSAVVNQKALERQQLRQKAEARVEQINKNQKKWTVRWRLAHTHTHLCQHAFIVSHFFFLGQSV